MDKIPTTSVHTKSMMAGSGSGGVPRNSTNISRDYVRNLSETLFRDGKYLEMTVKNYDPTILSPRFYTTITDHCAQSKPVYKDNLDVMEKGSGAYFEYEPNL